MGETKWLTKREERAWRGFLLMSAQIQAKVGSDLQRETGLSDADYAVLVPLSESKEGRLRPNELGCGINWEKSRLSHHLGRMEERGLVKRTACVTDRRGAFVVLTPAGRRAIEKAAPKHVEHVRRAFLDALTTEQLDALAAIADAVMDNLQNMS